MASFQNMVITTAGLELLQDLILEGGTPLTFSGVGVGDGLLEDSDITARTSLVHEVHRLPIEKIEKQEGGHIRVFARLATDIITTDFYHRELGIFARHGEQEILFAYGNAGDDYDFIPATGNNASICKTIVTEFTVGSMKAVFLPLDSKDFVTHEAMNAQVEEVITRETRKVLEAIPQVDDAGNMTLPGNLAAQGGTFAHTVNANGGVNIPMAPVTAGNAVNLGSLPMSIFMPGHALTLLKSLWECYGSVEDTASGIHIKDVVAGAFGGICSRVMQWSDYSSTATILTVISLTGGNGANVLIDAAYNPNAGVSITPVTSPDTAFLPNAVQLSLFETRQGTTITGRLVGVDGAVLEFSVPSQRDSHSCVYRVFLLETGSVIKAYLGKFTSGMFDGDADVLDRPVYLGEMPVLNNPRRFCFLGIGGIYGGEGNPFPGRIPAISDVRRYYGKWLINLFS